MTISVDERSNIVIAIGERGRSGKSHKLYVNNNIYEDKWTCLDDQKSSGEIEHIVLFEKTS